jgi:hypothetical protein
LRVFEHGTIAASGQKDKTEYPQVVGQSCRIHTQHAFDNKQEGGVELSVNIELRISQRRKVFAEQATAVMPVNAVVKQQLSDACGLSQRSHEP